MGYRTRASGYSADQEYTLDWPQAAVQPDNPAQKRLEMACGRESLVRRAPREPTVEMKLGGKC